MKKQMNKLVEVADSIELELFAAVERLRDIPEQSLRFRPSEDAWSIKEIIGHLIDSAANNHQRFVRLQLVEELTFPDYGQDNIHWVRIQNYQNRAWEKLLGLWRHYNLQLADIIRSVDPSCLNHFWQLEAGKKVTLFDLMVDYLRHLEDHLDQINDTLAASKEKK
ncbi:MAG: DinB family protein [Desulfobacterales bacterium]|jgi:hypothetical protein